MTQSGSDEAAFDETGLVLDLLQAAPDDLDQVAAARLSLVSPGAAYYVMTSAGIVLALGLILATFPLLRRITGSETARSE
jgi:hypothetical protein